MEARDAAADDDLLGFKGKGEEIVFLFRILFVKKIDGGKNEYLINNFKAVMDDVEEFVFQNI